MFFLVLRTAPPLDLLPRHSKIRIGTHGSVPPIAESVHLKVRVQLVGRPQEVRFDLLGPDVAGHHEKHGGRHIGGQRVRFEPAQVPLHQSPHSSVSRFSRFGGGRED